MEYEAVIGLEIHCELKTKSKNFCSCKNAFGGQMNTEVCPICMGMPGTLPSPNKKAFEYCIKAGLAFNCSINNVAMFERKNYFYPDLPKSYQISQLEKPICLGGTVDFEDNGVEKSVALNRIHLEEDAGKLLHEPAYNISLVDFNRASVPLIEIVTEPDIHSASDAVKVLETIKETLMYIDVADCKMQEGGLRCDVNVSVRKVGSLELNTCTEMKNLSSFKAVERAINFEIQRQIKIYESGNKVHKDTLKWDDLKGENYILRRKIEGCDYNYFPDPDLVPIQIEREYVEKIKNELPELPRKRRLKYINVLKLPAFDATVLTNSKLISDFFEDCLKLYDNPKQISNFIMSEVLRLLKQNETGEEKLVITPENFVKVLKLVENKEINRTSATVLLENIFWTNEDAEQASVRLNLKISENFDEILEIIKNVIANNPNAVLDYKNGNEKTLTFFMGQVMKASKGKAKPDTVNRLLKEELNK